MTRSDDVDWARLEALRGTDRDAASGAATFVWTHLFPNGRLTPATVAGVRRLAAMLGDPGLGAGDDTIRDSLLFLLREIARVSADADDLPLDADLLPMVFAAVWPIPAGWRPWTRAMAAMTAVMLVRHRDLADRRDELIAFHQEAVAATADRKECASYVIGLGELGVAPRAWLDDPRLAVRVCAALAPALAADDTAADVLVRAAEHPRAFDYSFTEPFVDPAYRLMIPPQFQDRPHRVLIRAVCERVSDSPRLFAAALAAMELRDIHQPKPEFGPYLRIAFPAGLTDDATASYHQQAFARAIADRDDLWDSTYHGVADVFVAAGLPYDRERWRNVRAPDIRDAAGRPTYDSAAIVVVTAARAVRKRPAMYLGVARTSPDLLRRVLDVITTEAVTVRTEAPLRFAVEANGTTLPLSAVEAIAKAQALGAPAYFGLAVAAALSLWVSVWVWVDATAYRQQFVDHVPMAPMRTLGPADRDDGYRIVFELDPEWLPPGARLPE